MAKKSVAVNGAKIRELLEKRGMSQEDLASKCLLNVRTLQRAEREQKVTHTILNNIATGLQVDLDVLRSSSKTEDNSDDEVPEQDDEMEDSDILASSRPGLRRLRLKRTVSARETVKLFRGVSDIHYVFDIDPSQEHSDVIAGLIELLYSIVDDTSGERAPVWEIRTYGKVNMALLTLAENGIHFFIEIVQG